MSIFGSIDRFIEDFRAIRAKRRYALSSINDPSTPIWYALTGSDQAGSVNINAQTVLGMPAVWNAVQQKAQDFGTFSKHVYKEGKRGVKEVADHPINKLLKEPNKIQTGAVFFESLLLCYDLRGNAIAYIKRGRTAKETELILLNPDRTEIKISPDGNIYYDSETMYGIPKEFEYKNLSADEVIHVPNLTYGGIWGMDIIRQFATTLSLTKAQENYNLELYENGATPPLVMSFEGMLNKDQREEIMNKHMQNNAGYGQHFKPIVLGQNGKVTQLSFNPEQMSFLNSRKFSVSDIARMTNMPLHKIKSMEAATNNNIEHQSKEYYQDTQLPIIVKFESELNRKLFAPSERGTYSIEWDMDDLLRADVTARYKAYAVASVHKFMKRNEIRAKEGLEPLDEGEGDFVDFQSPATQPAKEEKQFDELIMNGHGK